MSVNNFDIKPSIKLNNNINMPILGLGTWSMNNKKLIQAVNWALEAGYRHFDSARYYKNEKALGKVIRNSSYSREELFVTTKVWPQDFGYNETLKAFDASFDDLNIEYVNQYLIHWPSDDSRTHESWKALSDIYKEGKVKTIGVSNFSITDLERLKEISDIIPATNQIKFHPFCFDPEILEYCKRENIAIVSYSPLSEGRKLKNPKLIEIATQYDKTPAQIMLRWGIQHNTITIPKSSNKDRIIENASIFDFEISNTHMDELNSLS
ncbi:MAG: Glyoxal reductase [Candidatus Heimdallarchaeota archaeon LC_3]|nr:MAG: Glyoxal reductase [Candidatus Heimdallarchaeota archaeon LC_3]